MSDLVKDYITTYKRSDPHHKYEWEVASDDMYEVLEDNVVWEDGGLDQHRWYILQDCVAKIGDKFIAYSRVLETGDADNEIDSLEYCPPYFVEPYEATVTLYRKIKDEKPSSEVHEQDKQA